MANSATHTSVRLLTGGEFAIGDNVGAVRGQAQKSLFVLLALSSGRPVSRDRIVAMLWPDADPKAGRANLRAALLALKRALESLDGPVLDATNESIALANAAVDLDIFRRLAESAAPEDWRAALFLYQGDLWPEPNVLSEEFSSLLDIEREKWRSAAGLVGERLIGSIDACARPDDAIEAAHAMLKIDSAHEPTYRLLMRIFHEKGDRGAALRQFEQFRSILFDAYDLQPSAETCALRDDIARSGVLEATPAIPASKKKSTAISPDAGPTSAAVAPLFSRRALVLAAGAALAALAGVAFLHDHGPDGPARSGQETGVTPILAVEPFSHDATDRGLTEFVDSLRSTLLLDLASEGAALVTIAGTPDWRSSDVESEFHLRGSVQRIGESVKISMQLVSASDQTVVWADAEVVDVDSPQAVSHLVVQRALLALKAL